MRDGLVVMMLKTNSWCSWCLLLVPQGPGLPPLRDVFPDSRLPGSKLPVCGDEDRGGRNPDAARRVLSGSELCHAEVRRRKAALTLL